VSECSLPDCSTHEYVLNTLNRFDSLACQLVEGQQQLQLNVVRLTEQIENTKRLHDRVDSLERFMWKMVGVFAALSTVASTVLPLIFKYVGA
jgi:uncharacterized membrane protein YqjE